MVFLLFPIRMFNRISLFLLYAFGGIFSYSFSPVLRHIAPVAASEKIQLPGFFEVFPELKPKWPKWLKNKHGHRKPCKTDRECPFPSACCIHPNFFNEEKHCCSGWGRPLLIPAYAKNFITPSVNNDQKN